MKSSALSLAASSILVFGLFAAVPEKTAAADDKGSAEYPAPTNLKVLPKSLSGAQVREIMHQWESALGAECATCHVRDAKDPDANGHARFNYADDSKPEKAAARVMYQMVETINSNYVAKIENSGVPVDCWTCHRGRIAPEPSGMN
ncbi:MAG TPA: c-type cytochrome [Terracidiphilus sp.]|nr:c-type cytochrome [Terracidiphilus sp.]